MRNFRSESRRDKREKKLKDLREKSSPDSRMNYMKSRNKSL